MPSIPSQPPFWRDEPDRPLVYQPPNKLFLAISTLLRISFAILVYSILLFGFYELSPILMVAFLVLIIFVYARAALIRKRKKQSELDIPKIQQEARDRAGASIIGSAIHVAGHPQLEREQPVVLALSSEGLKVYSYDNPNPIEIIPLEQVTALQTVVYDDERTPHIDTIDSSAQALQMVLNIHGKEFTCLFRRMRKVRPIDWYHELQKAKWQAGQS